MACRLRRWSFRPAGAKGDPTTVIGARTSGCSWHPAAAWPSWKARRALRPGSLLLIERGERHEIRATGDAPLKTVNFYSPPAYTATGGERPAGRS